MGPACFRMLRIKHNIVFRVAANSDFFTKIFEIRQYRYFRPVQTNRFWFCVKNYPSPAGNHSCLFTDNFISNDGSLVAEVSKTHLIIVYMADCQLGMSVFYPVVGK